MAYWLLNDWGNKYLRHIDHHRFTRIGKETSLSDAIPRTVHSIRWSLLRFGRCWTRTTGTQHHCPLPGKYLPVQARQLLAGCIDQNKGAGLSHDETPVPLFQLGIIFIILKTAFDYSVIVALFNVKLEPERFCLFFTISNFHQKKCFTPMH